MPRGKKRILDPRILMTPGGLHWILGSLWILMDPDGFQWILVDSDGSWWILVHPRTYIDEYRMMFVTSLRLFCLLDSPPYLLLSYTAKQFDSFEMSSVVISYDIYPHKANYSDY